MAPSTRSGTGPQGATPEDQLANENTMAGGFRDAEPHAGLTQEQRNAQFPLEQRKLEADIAAVEARTARENQESQARIAAIQAGPAIARRAQATEEEDSTGEIPQAALLVASNHPGLPKAEIARIFGNKSSFAI